MHFRSCITAITIRSILKMKLSHISVTEFLNFGIVGAYHRLEVRMCPDNDLRQFAVIFVISIHIAGRSMIGTIASGADLLS